MRKITYELSALDFYVLLENGFNNSSHWVPLRSKLFNQHKEIRKYLRLAEDYLMLVVIAVAIESGADYLGYCFNILDLNLKIS